MADLDRTFEAAAARLHVCYAAAYFAETLRSSQFGAEVRLTELAQIARRARNATDDGDVGELADLIGRAAPYVN